MSAIGAIVCLDGVPKDDLATMLSTLGQVPHDEAASWSGGQIALAACTLHTTAESRDQSQPHVSEDGKRAIAFDGYLLNPEEITLDLASKGAAPLNRSDAEIALKAYETWGEDFAARLEGEFALIIADQARQSLIAARDHLGFVPLYYRLEGNRLIMASDLRTISALSRAALEPDTGFLAQIITNRWYLREETVWRGVKRVVRAHTLTFDGERIATRQYWRAPTDITIRYKRDEEYIEHYRDVLFDCVRRATRSYSPVGIAVSGGLDSSAIFAVADSLEKGGKLLAPGIAGYSLAAEEGSNAFELPYARAAANHLGRPLTEVPLFDPDIDWYTQDSEWHHDLPIPSNGAMMLEMENQVVEDGSRVIINGSGGDEWLTGSVLYYREHFQEFNFAGFARAFGRDWQDNGLAWTARQAVRQVAGEALPEFLRRRVRKQLRKQRRASDPALQWLTPELRKLLTEAEERFEAEMPEDTMCWAKHNLATSPFSDLTHSMMRRQRARIGVESRHPMLSRAFIEFSCRTPTDIKRRGRETKFVHRRATQAILAPMVLERDTKANFTNTKIDAQFANLVRESTDRVLAQVCDREELGDLLNIDFTSPEGDLWAWEIWGLYASAVILYRSEEKS